MQRSLTRSLLPLFLPACRFTLNPTGCFVSQSVRAAASSRKEYLVGIIGRRGVIRSVLLLSNSHSRRCIICGPEERSGPRNNSTTKDEDDDNALNKALNKKIVDLGKEEKWNEVLRLAKKEKKKFSGVNWATAFSQLGRARNLDRFDPRLESFVNEYAARFESRGLQWAGIRGVADVVHAIGKMKLKNEEALSILLFLSKKGNGRDFVREASCRGIANVAWAFATLDVKSPWLFAEIEARANWLVTNGTPQHVATAARAFAALGVKAPKLFAAIEKRADWLATEGNPRDVAGAAWAFATLNTRSPKLFAAIEARADWLVTNGKPQDAATAAWACAALGIESPGLFAAIETRADWLVTNGTPQAVANTIWAASHFQFDSPDLMKAANLRGGWLVEEGSTKDTAKSAIAFARVGYDASAFFAAAANNVSKLIKIGNPRVITNVCYAMAVLDAAEKHADAFGRLWNAAIDLDPALLSNEGLSQLGQVFVYCKANGMKLQQPPALLTGGVVQDSVRSAYQREVGAILGQLGLDYEREVSPLLEGRSQITMDKSMLSIDFACKRRMLAIECDGEHHFLRELGTGKRATRLENGATRAKRRFLRQTGWNVINIDYRDWTEAKKKKNRLEFLREKLKPKEECNNHEYTR